MKRIEVLYAVKQIRERMAYMGMDAVDTTVNRLLSDLEQKLIHPEPVKRPAIKPPAPDWIESNIEALWQRMRTLEKAVETVQPVVSTIQGMHEAMKAIETLIAHAAPKEPSNG
jgi:hypothetical protein